MLKDVFLNKKWNNVDANVRNCWNYIYMQTKLYRNPTVYADECHKLCEINKCLKALTKKW